MNLHKSPFYSMNSKNLTFFWKLVPLILIFLTMSAVTLRYAKDSLQLLHFSIFIIILNIILLVIAVFEINRSCRLEKIIPALAFGFGMLYLIVITPLSPPDELAHYKASYEISNHIVMRANPEEANAADFDFSDFTNHYNTSSGYHKVLSSFWEEAAHEDPVEIGILSKMNTLWFFVEYLPQVSGIITARFLDLNFIQTFYLGRFTNLLFYILCLSIAVKRTPVFKSVFGIVGLFPMVLQQAASFSYDAYINGLSFVFLASLIKAISEEQPLSKCDYLFLFLCLLFLAPAKGTYVFLVLLLLLIPEKQFGSKKNKTQFLFFTVFACAAVFVIFALPSMQRAVNSTALSRNTFSIKEIISSPGHILILLYNTINIYLFMWVKQAVGAALSGLSLIVPDWIIVSMLILAFLSAFSSDNSSFQITKQTRFGFISVSALILFSFIISMLITWSEKTNTFIDGIQGRYITPIFPLLIISVNSPYCIIKNKIEPLIFTVYTFLSSYTILYVVEYTLTH